MEIIKAVAPLHPRITPGDYPARGQLMQQILLAGMKIHSYQQAMRASYPGEKDTGNIISWLMNAFLNDRYSSVAAAHHGDSARSTGPRRFLLQLQILQNSEPYLGAPPLAVVPPCGHAQIRLRAFDA